MAKLDRIDEFAILECLRDAYRELGFASAEELAMRLSAIDETIPFERSLSCAKGSYVAVKLHTRLAVAALAVLREKPDAVLNFARRRYSVRSFGHLERLIATENRFVDTIFRNWTAKPRETERLLATGIYQLFRRYKPRRDQSAKGTDDLRHDWHDDQNHVVIAELLYLNFEAMECILITSELNPYFGSFNVNHEHQLFGLLQRAARQGGGIHQRFISSSLEKPDIPLHSGVCVKTGDTSTRPVGAEFLYLRVPEAHEDLYREVRALYEASKASTDGFPGTKFTPDSVVARYVTENPPIRWDDPRWQRVKFVRDFPALAKRVVEDVDGIKLFREPVRAIGDEQLAKIASANPTVEVFTHEAEEAAPAASLMTKAVGSS